MKPTILIPVLALLLGGVRQVEAGYITLDPPGSTYTQASGVSGNNVVGYYIAGGTGYGFLYQPEVSAVPEPSSMALMGTALLTSLGYVALRRRKLAARASAHP